MIQVHYYGGVPCPLCNTHNVYVHVHAPKSGDAVLHLQVTCNACGGEWNDEVELTEGETDAG